MKFYYVYYTTYHNNTKIGTNVSKVLREEEPLAETINLTWNNLTEWYSANGLMAKFNIWNYRRGRRVCFFVDKFFYIQKGKLMRDWKDIKEWKDKVLNVHIEITYKEFTPCIADILKWHEMDKAIIYLNERNLKIF